MPEAKKPKTDKDSFKLEPHPKILKPEKPLLVVVLDGWGEAEDDEYNAISQAKTPCMDSLKMGKPDHWMLLKAHGTAVSFLLDQFCWPLASFLRHLSPPITRYICGRTLDSLTALKGSAPCARWACLRMMTWATPRWATTPWDQAKW